MQQWQTCLVLSIVFASLLGGELESRAENWRQFRLPATNDLGDGNHASPAVAGGAMFLVGVKNVYCIRKK